MTMQVNTRLKEKETEENADSEKVRFVPFP